MKNKIKLILLGSSLLVLSMFFMASCTKTNNSEEAKEDVKEPIETLFPTDENKVDDEIINDDENKNDIEIINSESTIYGNKYEIGNSQNDYIGSTYVQISYVSGDELNLRYIFEVKSLDCDITLNYMIYKPNKTDVYMAEKTQEVKTVYKSYYENENLITGDSNTWFVIFTMRGIPAKYWDYFIDVNCNVYETGTSTTLANTEANKNALTILNTEHSSYLNTDYTFEYDNGSYKLTGYTGSDTELVVPEKALYTNGDESIYVNVTSIESNALKNKTKILLPKTIDTIKANAVSADTILCIDKTSTDGITNNTSVTIHPYSESYSANAWHYKNDVIRLWADTANITSVSGGNEAATVSFNVSSGSTNTDYNVYYSTDRSSFTKIDNQLILINGTSATAYLVGLEAGSYYIKVELADDSTEYVISNMIQVSKQDRSGYAHYNYTDGVGAYNDDGTLKDNTKVIYVTEETKNTVTATFDTTYTGLGNILKYLYKSSTPVCIRIIGQIAAATWQEIDYDPTGEYKTSKKMPASVVIGKNSVALPATNLSESDIINGGYNDLDTSVYSKLNGLTNKIKYEANGELSPYDSYYNMADISGAQNVTIEGIGNNAEIFQWGLNFKYNSTTLKGSKNIEVRNITFKDSPEDCCSFDGKEIKSGNYTSLSDIEDSNVWVHNCTFNKGKNYWDVCAEQDKKDGDGSTDLRYIKNVTFAYNHYVQAHKTSVIGSGSNTMSANITLHHNHYDNCERRMPYTRQANIHMYNNYYNNSTSSTMQIYDGAYAFIENCYFYNDNKTFELVQKSGYGQPAVKSYNNIFDGSSTYEVSNVTHTTDRTQTVSNGNLVNSHFDTDSSAFYYSNDKSDVTIMTNTSDVPTFVETYAGAGANFYNSLEIGTAEEINDFSINMYKIATEGGNYVTKHVKTIYKAGDSLDTSNLTINVDGTYTTNISDCLITGYSSTQGTYEITVNYLNLSDTYTVYVLPNSEYYNVAVGSKYSVGGTTVLDNKTYITFKTIEQGLEYLREFVTPTEQNRATLYISAGYYKEKLEIDVPYLTIKGAGICKATYSSDESYDQLDYNTATIIEFDSLFGVDQVGFKNITDSTQTVSVRSSAVECVIENLTISNWWNNYQRFNSMYDFLKDYSYTEGGQTKYVASNNKVNEHRALALLVQSDMFIMRDCSLLGYQDTLELFTGRQYFYNTYISGTTDYIFGSNNSTLFDNCIIHTIYNGSNSAGGYITAFKGYRSSTSDMVDYGVTFYKSMLEGDSNSVNVSLGRPWGNCAQVSFIECNMTSCISTTAYTTNTSQGARYVKMSSVYPTDTNVRFYEYGNTGLGAITSQQLGMTMLDSDSAKNCYDYDVIFNKYNGGVSYSLNWDPVNGPEVDNNDYYFFNGGSSSSGTMYSYTTTVEGSSTTLGDLTINATAGKLAYRSSNHDSQMNSGTKITFTASAGSTVTVDFYDTNYSINGIQATSTSMTVYFKAQTAVTILATGNTYLHTIIINKSAKAETTVSSLIYFGEFDAINTNESLDVSNLKVYALSNHGVYYEVTNYTVSISNGVNTYSTSDTILTAGNYTVTITYSGVSTTYNLTVVNSESVQYTYVFDFNSTDTEEADTATTKNYQVPSDLHIENTTGTIGDDFIINVTAGKLVASTNTYTQFNTGTTLTFTAPYNCEVTLVSYEPQQASINGVLSTSTTLTQQFTSGTTVTVLATGNGYLTSLTISPIDSVSSFTVSSIVATSTVTELAVDATFDTSTITVKAYDSSSTYYKKLSSSEYSVSSVNTSTAGNKTVTVTYGNLQSSFNITVIANLDNSISSNYCMEFSKNGIDSNFDGDVYKWSDTTTPGTQHKLTVAGSGFSNSGYLEITSDDSITFDITIPSGKTKAVLTIDYYYADRESTVTINGGSAISGTAGTVSGENHPYTYNLTESGTVTIAGINSTNYLNYISVVFQ